MIILMAVHMGLDIFIVLVLKLLLQVLMYLLAIITTVSLAMRLVNLINLNISFSLMIHFGTVNSVVLVTVAVTELASQGSSINYLLV